MTRPRSMTILGWLLIIGGLSSLYDGLSAATQPDGGAALKATGAHLWPYVTMNLLDAVISSACGFGVLAGVLAAVGLFGLMSYNVSRRTNEIGVRMALGARAATMLGLIMRESMWLVATGVGMGLLLAVAAGRLIASQLFGLTPTDVSTLVLATLLMVAVSAAAGYLPARRASRVDPNEALRYE